MEGKVTIREVARLAGVSVGSVSRVLNTPDKTSAETREAVRRAMAEIGYEVDSIARSMRTRATRAVGLLVHDIGNPIFAEVARAVQARLAADGYLLVLAGSGAPQSSDAALISMLHARRMDGLVAFLRDENDPATDRALERFAGPVVLVDRETERAANVVLSDHAGGMHRATRHLISLGHRRIGLVTGAGHILPGRERVRGFLEAHRDAGLDPDPGLIRRGSLMADFALRETSILMESAAPPTALIAAGSQLLEGTIAALRTRAVRLPSEMSVVGFDDSPLAALASPSITVVRRDLSGTGTAAAELLLAALSGDRRQEVRKVLLPTELVLRESTAPPRQ